MGREIKEKMVLAFPQRLRRQRIELENSNSVTQHRTQIN